MDTISLAEIISHRLYNTCWKWPRNNTRCKDLDIKIIICLITIFNNQAHKLSHHIEETTIQKIKVHFLTIKHFINQPVRVTTRQFTNWSAHSLFISIHFLFIKIYQVDNWPFTSFPLLPTHKQRRKYTNSTRIQGLEDHLP